MAAAALFTATTTTATFQPQVPFVGSNSAFAPSSLFSCFSGGKFYYCKHEHVKVAVVRVQAVGALRPFQFGLETGDDEEALKEDRVRAELMRAMVSDSSPDVRQAALAAVTKTVGMFDQASGGCWWW